MISIKLLLNEKIHNGFQHLFFFLKYSILSRQKFAKHSLRGLRKGDMILQLQVDFSKALSCSSLMCVFHMFMRTGPGHYSVGALTARPDLSAKWGMTAANTLSLCQVTVIPFMTRDTP